MANRKAASEKKELCIQILRILEESSSEEHPLTQQKILEKLRDIYTTTCHRTTIASNVKVLRKIYPTRVDSNHRGTYIKNLFEDHELLILIDSILFTRALCNDDVTNLITKLLDTSTPDFKQKYKRSTLHRLIQHSTNQNIGHNIKVLANAIAKKCQVAMRYGTYNIDGKLTPLHKGAAIKINPYQLVFNNGFYYLLGNNHKYNDMSHYRVDKIISVALLPDNHAKDIRMLDEFKASYHLPDYMNQNLYMYASNIEKIKLKITPSAINDVIDYFGTNYDVISKQKDYLTIQVKCSKDAMRYWALQFGHGVEVLSPKDLRDNIKKDLLEIYSKYEK